MAVVNSQRHRAIHAPGKEDMEGVLSTSPPGGARTLSTQEHRGWGLGGRGSASFGYSAVFFSVAPSPYRPRPSHFLPGPMSLGTPTEESWPGVTSISEFRAYNFPRYLPQPLLSHAPR